VDSIVISIILFYFVIVSFRFGQVIYITKNLIKFNWLCQVKALVGSTNNLRLRFQDFSGQSERSSQVLQL
jgi:hypothetical protein